MAEASAGVEARAADQKKDLEEHFSQLLQKVSACVVTGVRPCLIANACFVRALWLMMHKETRRVLKTTGDSFSASSYTSYASSPP